MDLCCSGAGTAASQKVEDTVVVMDGTSDATTAMIAARAKQPDLSGNLIYQDFLEHHEDYVRIHVHLVGLVSTQSHAHAALGKRRNRFGRPRVIDAIADPYVVVETVQKEGSATDYFPIASHKFATIPNCQTPVWDSKCILIVKKTALEEGGIQFSLYDQNDNTNDELLFTVHVGSDELPEPTPLADSVWTQYQKPPGEEDDSRLQYTSMEFSLMITEGSDRIVSPQDMEAAYNSEENGGLEYSEVVLPDDDDDSPSNNALLQCWKKDDNTKAVLWILGRNDCFMHPHVAKSLFWEQGYDLYVLNYKMNGACRKCGFFTDPHFNSHNATGNFDTYISDIEQSLKVIEEQEYGVLLGYAHSTGGPVLLDYLMEKGDAAFDGFLFNSPFLDWGFVGGDLVELVLENTGFLEFMGGMDADSKVGVATTPEGTTPLMYLGQEIVLSDWSARLWSLYYFDWGSRPLYKVPMTVGFAKGVTGVHNKMEELHSKQRPITAKPFLCITSRGDDVLKAPETLGRADWIGPGRWEIELNDNGHDIFLSYDKSDTEMAISMCLTWMKNRKFA